MLEQVDNLPVEVLLEIFSYLNPENIAKISRVNKQFKITTNTNLLWQEKFKQHFPYIFTTTKIENKTNWYVEFCKAYGNEYEYLSIREKKLFSLVKEGDISSLTSIIQLKDLDLSDKKNLSLFYWAKKKNNQKLLDYFYSLAIKEYQLGITIDPAKKDNKKRTILHWAIHCYQSVNDINLLIKQGAQINAITLDATTPLFIAAENGYLDVVKVLLEKNAEVNAACTDGTTPLHIAAQNGHLDVVKVLLENNAEVNAVHTDGTTPLSVANDMGHTEVAMCIKKQKLLDYLNKTNLRQDNHFKTSVTFFGYTFNFGYSAKQKKEAAKALQSVIFDGADKSSLNTHQGALNNGELKSIYCGLKQGMSH